MPQGYHHLDQDQRCQLYTLKERGDSLTAIAQVLGVHCSSICRELERNVWKQGYRYKQAHEKAQQRRDRACQGKKKRFIRITRS
jgi:transposase, IS30 family